MHKQKQHRDGEEGRKHGHPKNSLEVVRSQPHQANRKKRPQECTHGIQCLAQAESCAPYRRWGDVSYQCIARGTANPFANAIDKAGPGQPVQRAGQGKDRFRQCPQSVTQRRKQFALAQPIAECPGEYFGDRGSSLGYSFDEAHRQDGGTQYRHHVERQ
jgi:hypothetical protein